ncbi:hypothetical protein niasHT_024028 [Heterodera trifolii]|uniref:Uncharacterized protein n=1 Tax=Heterodera trifolii TaxID=157864 RepID=A0ABD2KR37_9BILA
MSSPSPPTFASHFKHSVAVGHGIGTAGGRRSPMRRVSLPSALPHPRMPNTLSPKLGFLKEISEFDIDPPFISPAASSSSSADTSPMLLSPSFQRPASARLYRRNPQHRHSQPNSPGSRKSRFLNRQPPPMGDGRTAAVAKEAEDDGFRWTDVDGFYGRKNSIPLQQLLANDLLNGANLFDDRHDELKPNRGKMMISNGMDNNENNETDYDNTIDDSLLNVEQQQNEMNIPSDITEDEDEEDGIEKEKKAMIEHLRRKSNASKGMNRPKMMANGGTQHREKVNMRRSMPQQKPLLDSPTKRNLFRQSKMRSFEGGTKEHIDTEEEQNEEEEEEEEEERNEHNLARAAMALGGAKVQFTNECNGMAFVDGTDESQKAVKTAAKEKRDKAKSKQYQQQKQAQQLRHFSIDAHGHRIVDSGIRTLRSPTSSVIMAQQATRNSKNRRATCPEIWLSTAEDSHFPRVNCALRLYGLMNCGKKTMAKQLASSLEVENFINDDDLASMDSEEWQKPYRTVAFLLNEREVHMEIIQGSLMPENRRFVPGGELTIFAVVYSVDNRESFIRAAQILFRLFGTREEMAQPKGGRTRKGNGDKRAKMPLILIANKIDLQRKRRVSPIEGKMLAKIYKCPFVEVSAMLSANMDTLWSEVLRKLQKSLQTREQLLALQQRRDSSDGDTAPSSPRHALVGRILERTRRFAKSCEDWIAARIVAI